MPNTVHITQEISGTCYWQHRNKVRHGWMPHAATCPTVLLIIIIIILLKQDYKIQLANNKIQMAWLTSWLVVG